MQQSEQITCKYINKHIKDLKPHDCGAFNIWEDDGTKYVDIEWCDGFTAFNLDKVLKLIKKRKTITKEEIIDNCH